MNGSSGNKFQGLFTSVFHKNFAKLDRPVQERVQELVGNILEDPFYNSEFLKGAQFRGKRKRRAGSYRVSYAICQECRQQGHVRFNDCVDCKQCTNDKVKFFDCGHRDKFYD